MGIFDFFAKEDAIQKEKKTGFSAAGAPINMREMNGGAIQVFHPRSFDDVEKIIDTLRSNKPAIVYLNQIKADVAQRVLDLLSGAIYALDGGVYEIEKNIFVFTPDGVNVN